MTGVVREYQEKDREQLLKLIIEVSDFERKFEANRLPGGQIGEKYFEYIFRQVKEKHGKVFVADVGGLAIGFVCFWIEPDAEIFATTLKNYAYISDLVVLPEYRGKGLGTSLLEKVKKDVADKGIKIIKVEALANNKHALNIYRKVGFQDYEVVMLNYL